MTTDTSEKGLESLIVADMLGDGLVARRPQALRPRLLRRSGTLACVCSGDATEAWPPPLNWPTTARRGRQFLARLEKEIGKRGVIDVLRHGVKHGATT